MARLASGEHVDVDRIKASRERIAEIDSFLAHSRQPDDGHDAILSEKISQLICERQALVGAILLDQPMDSQRSADALQVLMQSIRLRQCLTSPDRHEIAVYFRGLRRVRDAIRRAG